MGCYWKILWEIVDVGVSRQIFTGFSRCASS
jgi:hypothetical protein